ncbi:hypothetical protein [Levilactobacillus wangkuiensis]|uniref:hypothetical protein n=1 Tax=Levilactobacillus wangkuiensis TaxID=2799566 RepID=UPI00194195C8|nr:hypothetical protein [Levilactobacillus wangkuiensis]
MATRTKKATAKTAAKYSKASLVKSAGFKPIERDILSLKLDDKVLYSLDEAKKIIRNTKGGI